MQTGLLSMNFSFLSLSTCAPFWLPCYLFNLLVLILNFLVLNYIYRVLLLVELFSSPVLFMQGKYFKYFKVGETVFTDLLLPLVHLRQNIVQSVIIAFYGGNDSLFYSAFLLVFQLDESRNKLKIFIFVCFSVHEYVISLFFTLKSS